MVKIIFLVYSSFNVFFTITAFKQTQTFSLTFLNCSNYICSMRLSFFNTFLGRTVGAVHDEHSKPFTLTIDGKDVCGHDRAVGGESIAVRLIHTIDASIVVAVPTGCGATVNDVGTCQTTVTNPGSHPSNQEVGGIFSVKFLTTKSGYYYVKMTAGGQVEATIGTVYVAE